MPRFVDHGAKENDKRVDTVFGKYQGENRKNRKEMNIYCYVPEREMFDKFQLSATLFKYKVFAKSSRVTLLLKFPP